MRSTTGSSPQRAAAAPMASSASNSIIGQTTSPMAWRASSASENCASSSGGMPRLGLVAGVALVAPRADDVVGGTADMGHAGIVEQPEDALDDADRRADRLAVGRGRRRPAEVGAKQLVRRVEKVDLHDRNRSTGAAHEMVTGLTTADDDPANRREGAV